MAEIDWNVSEMRKPFTSLGACNVKRLVGILLAESDMILCEG